MTPNFNSRGLQELLDSGEKSIKKDFIREWKWQQCFYILIASTGLGILYPVFSDGFESIVPFINGMVIGLLGGITISAIELCIFPAFKRRLSLLAFVALKSAAYTLIISAFVFSVLLVSRSIQFGMTINDTFASDRFQHFLFQEDFLIIIVYALIFSVIVIFTREMNTKMGQGVLLNFVTGRYRKPGKEKRIFMFIDLESSVSSAESLGDMQYHNFLDEFFHDISECILMSKGIIYQYVGDLVVVTWPINKKTKAENCLRAFISATRKVNDSRERYMQKYGMVPAFKAAIHAGEVVYGEIGCIKSEIVFHGDVVNTTSRLERMCSDRNESLLFSQEYYDLLPEPYRPCFEKTETIKLRGKNKALSVFRLRTCVQRHFVNEDVITFSAA